MTSPTPSTGPPTTPASPPPRGRGRRPAAEVRAEVLDATSALLDEDGMQGVTFERVSTRSGASRTTLYRWWPSPGALAVEAYFARSAPTLAFPDTGDIGADLRTQLRSFVGLLTGSPSGRVIRELIGAAQTDPDLAAALSTHYSRPRRDLAVAAFDRARDRGQLREDVDPEVLVDQLWGACYHRLLMPDVPLDPTTTDAMVDVVLRGAAR